MNPGRFKLLAEMASSGEAVCVDGLATRVQRPAGWGDQKVLYPLCQPLVRQIRLLNH